MSGRKGMKHFGDRLIDPVLTLRSEGKTHKEIAEQFGMRSSASSKELVKRYQKKRCQLILGILPRKKGRPRKEPESEAEENHRLKRELEILSLFYQTRGRR